MNNSFRNNPSVFVVMAVHNRKDITCKCLKQLANQNYSPIQIIVVDDGSTDGTSEMIQTDYPYVYLLHGDGNYWWSKSMNLGINAVLKLANEGDLILTLNDDTAFDEDYVKILVQESIVYPNTLIGSLNLIDGSPVRIFSAGGKYNLLYSNHKPNIVENMIYKKELINDLFETDYLPGRGTLIPVQVFSIVGLYDAKKFPQYIADEEFSFRAKNAGFRCIVSSKANVFVKINTSGFENTGSKMGVKDFFKSLSAINSTNNIKYRINFSLKYAKYPVLFIIINLGKMFLSNISSIFGIRKSG